jgi:hypothetical protein
VILIAGPVLEDVLSKGFRTEQFPNDENIEDGHDDEWNEHGQDRIDGIDVIQVMDVAGLFSALSVLIDFRSEKGRVNIEERSRKDNEQNHRARETCRPLRHVFQRKVHCETTLSSECQHHPDMKKGDNKGDICLHLTDRIGTMIQRSIKVSVDPTGQEIDKKDNITYRQDKEIRR